MVLAHALVQTEVCRAVAITQEIGALPGVVSAKSMTGRYDIIVQAASATVDELGRLLVTQVQAEPGVARTAARTGLDRG